ncbi:MAG: 3-hydroxy-3-methylglutaryl CoA synthase [Actinobacteria bacterium]|nr:3-hydroxy-3-methylglutaryl CoA synthase [Actinomycetota bacterium]
MAGIVAYGGYVPIYRLNRMAVYSSMGWLNPANIMNAAGEKAVANFDEDPVTMAVAAARDAIVDSGGDDLGALYFASTTSPYRERLCANIVASALGIEKIRTSDFAGGLKAGTSALLAALDIASSGDGGKTMVTASDMRLGLAGSPQELIFGDGAGALIVGNDNVIAEFKGSYSSGHDFGDHVRGSESRFDRQWEERWIREEGFETFILEALSGICDRCGVKTAALSKVIFPGYFGGGRKKIMKKAGILPEQVVDNLQERVGDTGTAHPLLMLGLALEDVSPGDLILLVGYGSGCDALLFEATGEIENYSPRKGVSGYIGRKRELDNYMKYLVWRRIVPADEGLRAETDKETRFSLIWRSHEMIYGLRGSVCRRCGTQQYPEQRICVNPSCGAIDEMEPVYLSEKGGTIFSFTADMLTATINPPAMYGGVDIGGGGRLPIEFTDCTMEDLAVGKAVDFTFRIKFYDKVRDVTNYFWKAVPVAGEVN